MPTTHTMWRAPRRFAALIVAALVAGASAAGAATVYDGHLALADGRSGGASATLEVNRTRLAGTLSLTVADVAASGDYAVSGRQRGRRMMLKGSTSTGARLRWNGLLRDPSSAEGVVRVRWPGGRLRATLALAVRAAGSTMCDDVFRGDVMTRVLLPVCATCHVAGGVAQQTRLRVTADDPAGTRASVALLIDVADPPASLLLQKPVAAVAHGGGKQLAPGGAEIQILQHWVDLVTSQQCGTGGTPGGGDPATNLYTDRCASCHGADARGVGGRPAIRCNRDISGPVKSGRPGPTPEATMPAFPLLDDADIALLQGYLDGLCPASSATGAELFAGNCATCHGADAQGNTGPDVHCARSIGDAVRDGVLGVFPGSMPALMRITDPEIDRIQSYLQTLCPAGSASGATLYASNCATCHGTNGQGDGAGRPDIRCSVPSRISNAVSKGRGFQFPVMPSFVFTTAELTSIERFLAPFCTQLPADLFASNCATCHGPTGSGGRNADQVAGPDIRGTSSADVYDAVVDGTGGMPALPDLTTTQIDKIVSFLGGH